MKLFATLPLSSCSCERPASSLRKLNNYLRASQTEERLSALAIINNYDQKGKMYLEKHSRIYVGLNVLVYCLSNVVFLGTYLKFYILCMHISIAV